MFVRIGSVLLLSILCVGANAQWTEVFRAGTVSPGGWLNNGSGITFVQEAGTNPPPGNPNSPVADQQADDDFYFAGTYPAPIGTVPLERAFERAFAGTDNDLRIHFNLPDNLNPGDSFRFSTRPFNLHVVGPDTRYGWEITFNGTTIYPETIIRPADLGKIFTSAEFTAADVGAIAGPGGDNVIHLRGLNFNDSGGGNWMGLDYHALEIMPVPEPGSLAMMLSGLVWAIPMLWHEAQQARKKL
jgi:hypothetical protein